MSAHPEFYCQICGRRNIMPWFAPSDLWNVAFPGDERSVIACPQCFVERYEDATGHPSGIVWMLHQEVKQ